ncbi:hypothetical protein GCM10022206_74030 [Streptomyces chiangmaiensis]
MPSALPAMLPPNRSSCQRSGAPGQPDEVLLRLCGGGATEVSDGAGPIVVRTEEIAEQGMTGFLRGDEDTEP